MDTLERLKTKHKQLSEDVDKLEKVKFVDTFLLMEAKKEKLAIKDQIAVLEE